MKFVEADEILKKYNLEQAAESEFKMKTRNDRGKMNVGLRLRICADYLENKGRELRKERERIVKSKLEECPNYEAELKKNPYAHPECAFINMMRPESFCYECDYYITNIREIDNSIMELFEAAKCFRQEAGHDDVWQ